MKNPIIKDLKERWLINNRYDIWKDDGCIYDIVLTKKSDIPQWVFELRDKLIDKLK